MIRFLPTKMIDKFALSKKNRRNRVGIRLRQPGGGSQDRRRGCCQIRGSFQLHRFQQRICLCELVRQEELPAEGGRTALADMGGLIRGGGWVDREVIGGGAEPRLIDDQPFTVSALLMIDDSLPPPHQLFPLFIHILPFILLLPLPLISLLSPFFHTNIPILSFQFISSPIR